MDATDAVKLIASLNASKLDDQNAVLQVSDALLLLSDDLDADWDLIWEGLFHLSESHLIDSQDLLDLCGWKVISNGLKTAFVQKHIIQALFQIAALSFPEPIIERVFLNDIVRNGIQSGLQLNPRSFIHQADLGGSEEIVHILFIDMLDLVQSLSIYSDLCLQWAACGLRVFQEKSSYFERVALVLLNTLLEKNRPIAAYYCFRGMVEKNELLWDMPILSRVIGNYIEFCYKKSTATSDSLLRDLIMDDAILLHCGGKIGLLTLIGSVGIYLFQQRQIEDAKMASWLFISNIQEPYPLFSATISDYFIEKKMPELPLSKQEQVANKRSQLMEKIRFAEQQLHPRRYKISFASSIYNENVKNVFEPILNTIKNDKCTSDTLEQITNIDPSLLVDDAPLSKSMARPIESSLRATMIEHNKNIIKALYIAAEMSLEIKLQDKNHKTSTPFGVFEEFKVYLIELDEVAIWIVKTFLPDLWSHLEKGLKISEN